MVYNGYYKVMSNIPKMGQLPTPEITLSDFSMKKNCFHSYPSTNHKTNLGEPRLSPAWPWPSKCSPSTGALAPKVTIKPTFTDEKISKVAIQVGLIIIVGTSIISSESKVIAKLLLIKSHILLLLLLC